MNKKIAFEMISQIAEECIKNNITFNLSAEKKVCLVNEPKELGCSGFFDPDYKILSVATQKAFKDWFPILLHEYNHMLQYIEKPEFFGEEDRLWEWLTNKIELTKKDIKKVIDTTREIELDCEIRTVKMIEARSELEINIDDYIKKANSYLYFYSIVAKHRKWSNKPPYSIKEIVELMGNKFIKNYWKMPDGYEELVIKYCL